MVEPPAPTPEEEAEEAFLEAAAPAGVGFGTFDAETETITIDSDELSADISGTGFFAKLAELNVSKLTFTIDGEPVEVVIDQNNKQAVKDEILGAFAVPGLGSLEDITFTTTQTVDDKNVLVDVKLKAVVK